jgi:hypothetical protein
MINDFHAIGKHPDLQLKVSQNVNLIRIWITIPIPVLQTKRYQDPIQIRKSAYTRLTRREKATWA